MKLLALALLLAAAPLAAAAQDVVLVGPDGREARVAAAELAALPRAEVTLEAHGERHVYSGPLLIDVLGKVGVPRGPALRGPALASVVLISARDGYQVALAVAELDPAMRSARVILADRADGRPIPQTDGPLRLVVEGDLRPARSARMVSRIELRALAQPKP